jgi:mono/diheme cytochrome c family protein
MRVVVALLAILALAAGGAYAWATLRYPELAPLQEPPADFAAELVERGEALAAVGDCVVCHTAPGGQENAGGLPVETPFGTIHSTNITPDRETGIGAWSLEAFRRAMHEGVSRDGHYLYPAFPYDHFTRVSDEDVEAIYAYLMSGEPVANVAPANDLAFPFDQRVLLAGWNLLFLDAGRFTPDSNRSDEWNRGAYLAEGLGHCGACHTPRNRLGALDRGAHFGGATVEGWHAPALDAANPSLVPWTADAVVNYFLDGWDGDHGVAAGPMTPVVNQWAALSEDDAYALAEYMISFQDQTNVDERTDAARAFAEAREFGGSETPAGGPPPSGDEALDRGLATFVRVCANCHRSGTDAAPLGLLASINGPDPSNLIHAVVEGIRPPAASVGKSMPAFGGTLPERDLLDLVVFVRSHFSQKPAWTNVGERIREIRGASDPVAGTEETD